MSWVDKLKYNPLTILFINHINSLTSLNILGGLIDEDFHGSIGVLLINHGKESYEIKAGNRIAQMIIVKLHNGPRHYQNLDEKDDMVVIKTSVPQGPRVASTKTPYFNAIGKQEDELKVLPNTLRRGTKGFGSTGK
jgi:dUTPase